MATYFNGNSEIQGADGLQTLILMNPGFVGYSDNHTQSPPPGGNFVFLNSTPVSGNNILHAPPVSHSSQTQQFVGIPLSATATHHSHQPSVVHSQHEMSTLHGFMPRVQYSMYNPLDLTTARDITRFQQGLSLSLSSSQVQSGAYGSQPMGQTVSPTSGGGGGVGDDGRLPGGGLSSSASGISNGVNGMQSVLLNSKYLKATQELLDEVVSVGKGALKGSDPSTGVNNGQTKTLGGSPGGASGEGQSSGEMSGKRGAELTTAERQEIQMKKAKLVNMLDEVEQRYRQYHNQMQIVISWFEQAAGIGSAKTYTALALQTISKQFRCLKDAILGQVKAASKSLGEDDGLGGGRMDSGGAGGSRLKFVDNQLRQQRALQQLGMIQHNAWRPQRGLPERSVSVLRAWLFEHFLHPYPKDSDKHMLAKQTGLTRSQVSNWFINARVRLWKPMVEEMYLEEIKEHEQNGSEDKTSKSEQNEDSASKSTAPQEKSLSADNQNQSFKSKQEKPNNMSNNHPQMSGSTVSTSPSGINFQNHSGFTLIGSSGMETMAQFSPKKARGNEKLHSPSSMQSMNMDTKPGESNNDHMSIKFGNERQSRDGFTFMGSPTDFMGGLGPYPIGEIGRFSAEQFQAPYSGNGVSLTLGLPHCENLSMQGGHQSFLPNQNIQLGRGVEMGEQNEFGALNTPTSSHSAALYETMNIQNRKRFAAQLLPDFVA